MSDLKQTALGALVIGTFITAVVYCPQAVVGAALTLLLPVASWALGGIVREVWQAWRN